MRSLLRLPVFAGLLLCAALAGVGNAKAATLVVTNTADNGAGSLRDTIAAAANGDTIQFDPALNGQTIVLTSGELVISRNITIDGPGPSLLTIRRDQQAALFRIFHVLSGASPFITDLTITGGAAPDRRGGGILNDGGTLSIINCNIHDNLSLGGLGATGGGIYNASGAMTITQSTISNNATLSGGGIFNGAQMQINNSTISGNHAYQMRRGGDGGGISNGGTLTINDSVVSSNLAGEPNPFPTPVPSVTPFPGGYGGGIVTSGSTLTIHNSIISGNTATDPVFSFAGYGGGIRGGPLDITGSTINNNHADKTGGGIDGMRSITITDSTISGNNAGDGGGGIYYNGYPDWPLVIQNSTISGNTTQGSGGGVQDNGINAHTAFTNCTINNNMAQSGGGFWGGGTITNSTISGNIADWGAGILIWFNPMTITHSTFADNASSQHGSSIYNRNVTHLRNTILKTTSPFENVYSDAGSVDSLGYNLCSDNGSNFFNAPGDQINTDPILGPLQDNGGPTFTHELLLGSPAINTGDPNFTPPPLYDQRGSGYPRVITGRIDIGSFEVQSIQPTPTATATATATSTPIGNDRIFFDSNRDGNDEIYVMDSNGLNQLRVTNNSASDIWPRLSPDGTKIAFQSNRASPSDEIFVMTVNGANPVRLTTTNGNFWPNWSPDGTKIAFSSIRDPHFAVYVMNANGSNQIRLTDPASDNSAPSWSPDGTKIAFQTYRNGDGEIYVMDSNGANPINLTNNPQNHDLLPVWSPNGTKIAFYRLEGSVYRIWLMDANGSNQVALTDGPQDYASAWSPDSTKIVFTRSQNDNSDIYVMNADGSNQVRLTTYAGSDGNPNWGIPAFGTPSPTATATATATAMATASPTATATPTPPCLPVITQSSSQAITTGNSASCNDGVTHTDNSYWRAFDMAAYAGGGQYCISSVSFGVEFANTTQPVTVRLYTTSNFPTGFPGSLTQIGTTTLNVGSAQNGTVVTTPLVAIVPAGTPQLVMELFTPNGQPGGYRFFVGSNAALETGPSYFSAPACGITTPTTTAASGFPNMHIVFDVNGTCICPTPTPNPCPIFNVTGTVGQCTTAGPSGVALPGVTITRTISGGGGGGSTTTDENGNYFLSGFSCMTNTYTPSKAARLPGSTGINTTDVVAVQRHFLAISLLTGCRLAAADCASPRGITTADVIAIQRFFLGQTTGIGNVGSYSFTPPSRSYSPPISNQTAQNYDTIVFGDVASPFAAP